MWSAKLLIGVVLCKKLALQCNGGIFNENSFCWCHQNFLTFQKLSHCVLESSDSVSILLNVFAMNKQNEQTNEQNKDWLKSVLSCVNRRGLSLITVLWFSLRPPGRAVPQRHWNKPLQQPQPYCNSNDHPLLQIFLCTIPPHVTLNFSTLAGEDRDFGIEIVP